MKIKHLFNLFIAGLFCFAVVSSCKKTGPAEALIIVKNISGGRVQGATVVLRQDSVINANTGVQADVNQSKVTDFNGEALFEFKLEAVLNLEVTYDTFLVRDYIKLEQSEQVSKEIVLQ
ncbi:MAG: hypothetical protein ACR2GN_06510 [Bacteroidia bacterium]